MPYSPFFSPDGEWLAYASEGQKEILKVRRDGSVPLYVADIPVTQWHAVIGGAWCQDDWIYLGLMPGGIYRVPAAGGEAESVLAGSAEELFRVDPSCLRDGDGARLARGRSGGGGIVTKEKTKQQVRS